MVHPSQSLRSRGIDFVRFVWCDNANVIRAKATHIGNLDSVRDHGLGISFAQQAVPVVRDAFVAESGLGPVGEVQLTPDWSTLTGLPFARRHARVFADLTVNEQPWEHCPRGFLRRMLAKASDHGLELRAAFENEFYLLKPTPDGYEPFDNTLFCSVQAMNKSAGFLQSLVEALMGQGLVPVNFYPESGHGQFELSIEHTPPLLAADQQVVFRETVHAVADQAGLKATFLPKPFSEQAGSGCHLHFSLWRDGENLSADPNPPDETTAHFMAGILDHLPGLMAITAPTRNSYARIGKHLWSGAYACWGFDNREAAIRIPTSPEGVSHFELKTHDASANPYLALGAVIAAGLDGIERKLSLMKPIEVDPGLLGEHELSSLGIKALPTEQSQALESFEHDTVLQEALGEDLARSFLWVKREELTSIAPLSHQQEVDMLLERY